MKVKKDHLITILKEKYDYELQRKLYFENVLNLPVTLLGFLTTGVFYMLNGNSEGCYLWFIKAKPIFIILLILSIFVSVFFVFKVYFQYKRLYKSFPESQEVNADFIKIVDYEKGQGITTEKVLNDNITGRFQDFIIKWYVEINTENSKINDTRGDALYFAKMCIGVTFIISTLTFLLLFISKI